MRRRIVQHQHSRPIHIPTKIVYRVDQELAVDVALAFIGHTKIVGSKDAEQIYLLVASRKNLNALAFWRPTIRQARAHRKRAFVAEI